MVPRFQQVQEELKQESLTITRNHDQTIRWCMENNILAPNIRCPSCDSPMTIQKDTHKIDKCRWVCSNRYFTNCQCIKSIRENSLLKGCKLTLQESIRLMLIHYINHDSYTKVIQETQISRQAICSLFKKIKTIFQKKAKILFYD